MQPNEDARDQARPDLDPELTLEWIDSVRAVVDLHGPERARALFDRAAQEAAVLGAAPAFPFVSDYVNTVARNDEPAYPGDEAMEDRIEAAIRWNAAAMVVRANIDDGLGGHLSTYASAATLYEVALNHFLRGKQGDARGDQVVWQAHASPGLYARAFVEGRLDEGNLESFRREVTGRGRGLPSYPHPRSMPDFWEFPSASMGIGALNAIYQARFNRYLHARGLADTESSRVWCFTGDGELDEPESIAALTLAAREQLDNLILVVNGNLQRLDGPVRGNGKVLQEFESLFRGAGWNVVKVLWGREWDSIIESDTTGELVRRLDAIRDGDLQRLTAGPGSLIRDELFGGDPDLTGLVAHLSDEQLVGLPRGGHDRHKVYAAYDAAVRHEGSPTVVLAQTVKGWRLGDEFVARNATHQMKKMAEKTLGSFRDDLGLEIADEALAGGVPPFFKFDEKSPEWAYLTERRRSLGGFLPERKVQPKPLTVPGEKASGDLRVGGDAKATTTAACVRLIRNLSRDAEIGRRIVPIIPDEARTFGLDALFREIGIYAPGGQKYKPVDASLMLSYKEAHDGQILEEGITEAGAMGSFAAAGTSYATWGEPMIPFYMFYSIFGFQRVGDLIWAFGDARGRGFLLGATAGRTTLQGEGLQHDDGQSLVLASILPNCRVYDPAVPYEVAVIIDDGLRRMYGDEPEDAFYYLTLYNEPVINPALPEGAEEGIVRGLYRFAPAPIDGGAARTRILASGTALLAALEAQELLAGYDVAAEVWSATSYKALREDALSAQRWNRFHPDEPARVPYVTSVLSEGPAAGSPVVAVSDYMRAVADQVAAWIPAPFVALGTDGYGLSDTRVALRRHFETDAAHIALAALSSLAEAGDVKGDVPRRLMKELDLTPDDTDPWRR